MPKRETRQQTLSGPTDIGAAPVDVEATLDALTRRYKRANGPGMQVLTLVGGQAESLLDRLPKSVRERLDGATRDALELAMAAADRSRDAVGDGPGWMTPALTAALGAAGGFGGLATSLAELPVTTTVLLRAIQAEAAAQGFDPSAPSVRFDCVEVFAAAGPMSRDDGADLGFLSARLTLSGASLQKLIAAVAPRLAAVLGQKLAAQAVPVLGAAAGAATNYAFTSYYQDMAAVHFGLRRLAIEADRPHADLVDAFRDRLANPRLHEAS